MSDIPKVGVISCSGEECPGGNISRAATLRVLHDLRPDETVTICLPLFLAGGEGERAFAKKFPTITVDGCGKLCAAIGTEHYSNEPTVKINLEDYVDCSSLRPEEKWHIVESADLVEKIAADIAKHIDSIRNYSD
ncbi:hypothetical protein EU527_15475 [Candidatus Thorarchaeota archaeon]|nr:MAG: hypothetical protein EU527_15475 [Candidatus Thorarchaeota archaeon]